MKLWWCRTFGHDFIGGYGRLNNQAIIEGYQLCRRCGHVVEPRKVLKLYAWDKGLNPGSCGEAILIQSQGEPFFYSEQLFNIARGAGSTPLEAALAAKLYVTEKRLLWLEAEKREKLLSENADRPAVETRA